MNLFKFEKWFIDFHHPGKAYIIVFHTYTQFIFIKECYLEIQFFLLNEDGKVIQKGMNRKLSVSGKKGPDIQSIEGFISVKGKTSSYDVRGDDYRIQVEMKAEITNHKRMLVNGHGRGMYYWAPLVPKGIALGSIQMEDEFITLKESASYLDYVVSTFRPRKVPVYELFWGRLIHTDALLTFSIAFGKNTGQKDDLLYLFHDKKEIMMKDTILQIQSSEIVNEFRLEFPVNYIINAKRENVSVQLKIKHRQKAIISDFTESIDKMGRVGKKILKQLSGDPAGIKYFADYHLIIETEDGIKTYRDEMITEYVVFRGRKKKQSHRNNTPA